MTKFSARGRGTVPREAHNLEKRVQLPPPQPIFIFIKTNHAKAFHTPNKRCVHCFQIGCWVLLVEDFLEPPTAFAADVVLGSINTTSPGLVRPNFSLAILSMNEGLDALTISAFNLEFSI